MDLLTLSIWSEGEPVAPAADAWFSLTNTMSFAITLATVLGLIWAVFKFILRTWDITVGSRQLQRRTLNSLFLGANIQYVEGVLGYPTLVSRADSDQDVHRYRLPDCWVSIGFSDRSAQWMSVTVTDVKFKFRTDRFTAGLMDARLGSNSFEQVAEPLWFSAPDDLHGSPGQKEQIYTESREGVTAFRSQQLVLGYTNLGFGTLELEDFSMSSVVRAKTTVNSLAIAKPFALLPHDAFLGWQEAQVVPLGRKRPIRAFLAGLMPPWS